jgi:predicted ABC-type ATPase
VKKPRFTIIAGANGSGKSTLTYWNREIFREIPILDPDAIAETIQAGVAAASPIAAGREVLDIAASHLNRRTSFAVETTLSGKNYLRMMLTARERGFEIVVIYIGTNNVEINLNRIAGRVLTGGHDVPEGDVRRRFLRSFQNFPTAIVRADHAILFDNSSALGYQLVGVIDRGGKCWFSDNPPAWAVPFVRERK